MTISARPRFLGGRNVGKLGRAGWLPSCRPSRRDSSVIARCASEWRVSWDHGRWPLAGGLTSSPLDPSLCGLPRGGPLSQSLWPTERARQKESHSTTSPVSCRALGPAAFSVGGPRRGHTPRQGHRCHLGGCLQQRTVKVLMALCEVDPCQAPLPQPSLSLGSGPVPSPLPLQA